MRSVCYAEPCRLAAIRWPDRCAACKTEQLQTGTGQSTAPLTHHQLTWMTRHSQNRFDTGSPLRDSSQARLVAEAAFAPRPITVAANAEPQVVVIKRKKAIVPAAESDPIKTEIQEPMKEGRDRKSVV